MMTYQRLVQTATRIQQPLYKRITQPATAVPTTLRTTSKLPQQPFINPKRLFSSLPRLYPNKQVLVPRLRPRPYTTQAFQKFSQENPILLRDACQCKECVDQSTHQRDFLFSDIPTNISVSSTEPDPETGTWKVKWNHDIPSYDNSHTSIYPQSTLIQLLDGIPTTLDVHRPITLWDKETYTTNSRTLDYTDLLTNETTLTTALEQISRLGLLFITGIPPKETDAVKHLVTRLALLRNTFYGETWDVKSVPSAKNVAYTNKYLGFHMDLLYMKEPPGLQLLHCIENSSEGGESLFADTFKAVDVLRRDAPRHVERLTRSKIRYGYENAGHFYSDEKPVIKLVDRHNDNTTGGKHTPNAQFSNATDPEFLQSLECTYWSPPFINSIAHSASDGDTPAFIAACKSFADTLERPDMIYEVKMEPGTCTVFDNLRVVHARREFDVERGGGRWLRGAYGDRQDVLSRSLGCIWGKSEG